MTEESKDTASDSGSNGRTYSEKEYNYIKDRADRTVSELSQVRQKLDAFGDLTPDKVTGLQTRLDDLEAKNAAGDEGAINELIARKEEEIAGRFKNDYGKKLDDLSGQLEGAQARIRKFEVVDPATKKAADMGFISGALEDVQGVVQGACAVIDGEVVAVDSDGKPLPSKKDPRESMKLEEFLGDLATKKPHWIESKAISGTKQAGTKSEGSAGDIDVQRYLNMSPEQRAALPIRENRRLAALAVKQ